MIEAEPEAGAAGAKTDDLATLAESDVAKRVRALHSNLILEAVNLRNEVAALKTRKGVTIGMIAELGGKLEGQALEKELEELVRSRKKSSLGGSSPKKVP